MSAHFESPEKKSQILMFRVGMWLFLDCSMKTGKKKKERAHTTACLIPQKHITQWFIHSWILKCMSVFVKIVVGNGNVVRREHPPFVFRPQLNARQWNFKSHENDAKHHRNQECANINRRLCQNTPEQHCYYVTRGFLIQCMVMCCAGESDLHFLRCECDF